MQPCPSRCTALRLMGQALRFAARPLGSHKGRLCLAPRPTARAAALPLHFNCALVRARAARQHGYLLRRCAHRWRNDPRPPRAVCCARASALRAYAAVLAAVPPVPLQGASRVCTREIVAQAHGMPCETPATPPRGSLFLCVVYKNKTPGRSAVATERREFCVAAKEGGLPWVYLSINCTA